MRFLKSNRHIKYGVIHTSDTYENQDIGAEDIDLWHRTDPDKKFRMIGYHGVIHVMEPMSLEGCVIVYRLIV